MISDRPAGRSRLVVLAIDAASPDLLDRWIAEDRLPNLAALVARGTAGRTLGVEGFHVGATWPSMYTGTNPSRHGVHYLLELVPGTYQLRYGETGDFVRRPPFWKQLSRAGHRVAILDVPLTRLDHELPGVQVVEWGSHDTIFGFQTQPAALAAELHGTFGVHPLGTNCDGHRRSAEEYDTFVNHVEAGARTKGELTCTLLARDEWDFFMQVFTEAHCTGHQCWHLHDPAHPAHDPAVAAAIGDPLLRAYQAVDESIGRVIEAAGDATVVVFSAHGMSHWYGAQFLLRDILFRLGAAIPEPPVPLTGRQRVRAAAEDAYMALPEAARVVIRRMRRAARSITSSAASGSVPPVPPSLGVDVFGSRCFVQPNGQAVGGIRLNLVGREPHGVLQPGTEAEAFTEWLIAAFLDVVNADTGRPLIRRVLRTASHYSGELLHVLPDLLVEWDDERPTGNTALAGGAAATVRASSPLIGTIERANEYVRTGEHRPGGWLVAAGPDIAVGRLAEPARLIDLAPTFTAMLGVTLDDCDGQPIAALLPRRP